MRSTAALARKALTVLVTVVFALAVLPLSNAAPAHHGGMSQMVDCAAHCASKDTAPQKTHGTPCKDMANCGRVQSCSTLTAIQQSSVAYIAPIKVAAMPWYAFNIEHGITIRPDNPPPIV